MMRNENPQFDLSAVAGIRNPTCPPWRKPSYSALVALFSITCATLALAQTGDGYDLTWNTFDGGGHMFSAGSGFELGGTIGQPDAGPGATGMSGGGFALVGGFWSVAEVCYCPGDLNGDGKKNGLDVQRFVGCQIAGGNCSCADVDGLNGVNPADVSAFVTALLAGAACP